MSSEKIMTGEELKKCLSDILYDFANYCDEHGLQYTLAYGTLLGAVRHKGFIPWDDDIDVLMPREDYNKLHELIKTNPIKENYVLESITAGNSPYPFAKILDINTKIINSHSSVIKNLWIDIFPLDGVSEVQAKNINSLQRLTTLYIRLFGKSARKIEWSGVKTTAIILLAHIHSTYYYGKKLDRIAQKNKFDDCIYAAGVSWGSAYRYLEKNIYCETCKLEFEGKVYYAPKDYDTVLRRIYGDNYMELPPEEERDTHNIEAVFVSY